LSRKLPEVAKLGFDMLFGGGNSGVQGALLHEKASSINQSSRWHNPDIVSGRSIHSRLNGETAPGVFFSGKYAGGVWVLLVSGFDAK
jgi:hypothetical protein